MKRIIFLLMASFAMINTGAQDITDGLRYSSHDLSGTARFNALSGAFGALGGDLSAININPAGSAVFLSSSAAFTLSVGNKENKATYFNRATKSDDTGAYLDQAGGVFVFKKANDATKWKKFTIAVNYQTTKKYDEELMIKGVGNTSIGEFFLAQAQGVPLDLLQLQGGESISDLYAYLGETQGSHAQNAFLGYQGFIIDPVDPSDLNNDQYFSNIANGNFQHEYEYITQGSNGKFTVNFGTQLNEIFYLGLNINTHAIDYECSTYLFESNSNKGSLVTQVGFENNLSVNGTGFSAQLGAIAKIQNNFRLGLSLESPSWYDIAEETTQYLETRRMEDGNSVYLEVNPRVLNVYESYYLRTPGKITASAAYIFGSQALLSFDYSYKDYGSIKFDTYDDESYFDSVNSDIEKTLKGASSFRVGGEYRIKRLSLRGGFRFEESPYKNKDIIDDLSGYSCGLGYNLGKFSFDLAYNRAEQKRKQQLYSVGLTDSSRIETTTNDFAFTLGFNF